MPAKVLFHSDARREGQVAEDISAVEVEPDLAWDVRLESREPFADASSAGDLDFGVRRRAVVRKCRLGVLVEHELFASGYVGLVFFREVEKRFEVARVVQVVFVEEGEVFSARGGKGGVARDGCAAVLLVDDSKPCIGCCEFVDKRPRAVLRLVVH